MKPTKKLLSLILAVLMSISLLPMTAATATAAATAPDNFDLLRTRWVETMTGGDNFNPNDPNIAAQITSVTATAQTLWDTMVKTAGRTYLWSDCNPALGSTFVTNSYNNLRSMAIAYMTKGSSLYGNQDLFNDLISALDWGNTNLYSASKSSPAEDWWFWDIGSPTALADILCLLYDGMTPDLRNTLLSTINHYCPDPTQCIGIGISTGANRSWGLRSVLLSGILSKNESKVIAARNAMNPLFDYVTSGDGYYKDGSFIQHLYFSYAGGYGLSLFQDMTNLTYLLSGSAYDIVTPTKANLYKYAYDTYASLIYNGQFPLMTMGRNISRVNSSEQGIGASIMRSLAVLATTASPADKAAFTGMLAWWQENSGYDFIQNAPIFVQEKSKDLMAGAVPVEPADQVKIFAAQDQAVMQRSDFSLDLAMYSNRTQSYEGINSENLRGWYTNAGALYLNNSDTGQFNGDFLPTVNSYMLPGVTALNGAKVGQGTFSNAFAGGVTTDDGVYGAAGMIYTPQGLNLTAKKSYFMLNDEIVCLGNATSSNSSYPVYTTVENRKINGDNTFTINGQAVASTASASPAAETVQNAKWAYLSGNVAGSDIGYYFPEGQTISAIRQTRTDCWQSLNTYATWLNTATNLAMHTNTFLTMWMNHGTTPQSSPYAYVILPGKSSAETEAYSQNPDISILAHDENVHAVYDSALGITAANFWTDGSHAAGIIASNEKASVITKVTDDQSIEIDVSDPTMANAGAIDLGFDWAGTGVVYADPGVNVFSLNPLQISVNVANAKGKTFSVKVEGAKSGLAPVAFSPPAELNDDFESAPDNNWTPASGTWSIVMDNTKVYKQSAATGVSQSIAGNAAWADYSYQANIKPLTLPSGGSFGLNFRYQDPNNYYTACFNANNTIDIRRKINTAVTVLTSKAYTITPGTTYTVKVVANGDSFELWINGEMQLSASDSTFASGKIGLQTNTATAEFDNVSVTPDTSAPSATPTPTPSSTPTPSPTPDQTPTTTPTPSQSGGNVIVENDDPSIIYNGSWGTTVDSYAHGGSLATSGTANSFADFTFAGTSIQLYAKKGPAGGIANIYIDDMTTPVYTYDGYSSTYDYQKLVYQNNTLSAGTHTIRILVTGTHNTSSTGYNIMPDYFVYSGSDGSGLSPTPTLTPPAEPDTTPPASLFSDDFENVIDNNWSPAYGTWSIVTDNTKVYKQSTATGMSQSTAGNITWDNYSYQADVKPLTLPSGGGAGLNFRYQDPYNYCTVCLNANNTIDIRKKVNGTALIIASGAYTITPGTTYTVKVVADGDSFELWINGEMQLSASDSTFASGKIGLQTNSATAEFDNVSVMPITPAPSATPTPPPSSTPTPSPTPDPTPTTTPTPNPSAGNVIVENDDPSIIYTGSWGTTIDSNAHGGSLATSGTANSYADFTFAGTSIQLYAKKGPAGGIANIYIDDMTTPAYTYDGYSSTYDYQQLVYQNNSLSAGTHTIRILVTGTHNTSSTGYNVMPDYFVYSSF